ncbi:MAG: hypothetical protein M1837_006490 [Sclerophora amabilis]|nr:MAG: hypothetical protein M1837_006490 [Sclerophora amabilis]
MFQRRRTPSNAHLNHNPTPSAATAAAQAFLANQKSNASLSSAAASAALRTHVTSPTPVGDVQTKRILRRKSSASSNGSGSGGVRKPGQPGLQRQNSSSSMSERSFRDQSPNRGTSYGNHADPPPVPALPEGISSDGVSPFSQRSHRRAVSLEAPFRVASPTPSKATGRGISLDRGAVLPVDKKAARRVTSLAQVPEQGSDPNGRGSVNFSYPLNGANSPPVSPTPDFAKDVNKSSLSKSSTANAQGHEADLGFNEAAAIQHMIQQSANKPVKKKKKKVAPKVQADFPHLADKSIGGKPRGTALNSQQPFTSLQSPTQSSATDLPSPLKTGKKKKTPKPSLEPSDRQSFSPNAAPRQSHNDDDDLNIRNSDSTPEHPQAYRTRAGALLSDHPSILHEEPEKEAQEETLAQSTRPGESYRTVDAVDTSSPRTSCNGPSQVASPGPGPTKGLKPAKSSANSDSSEREVVNGKSKSTGHAALGPPKSNNTSTDQAPYESESGPGFLDGTFHAVQGGRPQSLSPGRSAHFSLDPPLTSPNVQRHQPPPRSLSPAKSAMKQSSSPRTLSPASQALRARNAGHRPSSETSEISTFSEEGISEAGVQKKKKNVRVSFDEDSVLVHDAVSPPDSPASPQALSPQHKNAGKRNWFGLGRSKKTDATNEVALEEEEPDDVLKPRPALPSFGSVRGRTQREDSEDHIQKVTENVPVNSSENAYSGPLSDRSESSNDHAIGTLLSPQDHSVASNSPLIEGDFTADQQSDETHKPSEPLPPEVTSVEGTGYVSDSDGSVYGDREEDNLASKAFNADTSRQSRETSSKMSFPTLNEVDQANRSENPPESDGPNIDLPAIELVEPTPIVEDGRSEHEWFPVPGEFPGNHETNVEEVPEADVAEHFPTGPTPSSAGIAEPEPENSVANYGVDSPSSANFADELRARAVMYGEEESGDESSSIYSDAAEDFSDLEGNGYGSIDAVVESPVVNKMAEVAMNTPIDHSSSHTSRATPTQDSSLTRSDSSPRPEEGWDKAQTYWSGLSEGRKEELERAASPDTRGAQAVIQPKPKASKKKLKPKSSDKSNQSKVLPQAENQNSPLYAPSGGPKKTKQESAINSGRAENLPSRRRPEVIIPERSKDVSLRSSLRDGQSGPVSPRGASPNAGSKPMKSSLRNSRPTSVPMEPERMTSPSSGRSHARGFSSNTVGPNSPTRGGKEKAPVLSRTRSDGSDSSASASSFRKSRRRSPRQEGFAMRRSMRGPPDPALESHNSVQSGSANGMVGGNRSSRFSIRSSSPSGSTTGTAISKQSDGHTMRSSLRNSTATATPSLRANPPGDHKKSSGRFGSFGKSPKAKSSPSNTRSRFSSRFADSSDEEGGPAPMTSRFADSSDENDDGPAFSLTPVRGIPRRTDEEDKESTDLPDSSEDETPSSALKVGKTTLKPPERSALATGSLRRSGSGRDLSKGVDLPNEKKKRSLFGALGRRKDTSKVQKLEGESAARRDTPLERTRTELQSTATSPTGTRPKLVKRMTPKRMTSGTWPLPAIIGNDDRPSTSDGILRDRPDLGTRRATTPAPGEESPPPPPASPTINGGLLKKEKKKHFLRLRKAFGLH